MIDDKFNHAIEIVLRHEGGLSDNKNDPGGITRFGISLRSLKALNIDINDDGRINAEDIRALSVDAAKGIYKTQWWDKYKYDRIENIDIATKIMDLSVNMGPSQAHKLAQRAANRTQLKPIVVDGILGTHSFRAINRAPVELYLREINDIAAYFYKALARDNPELNEFLKGWLNRIYD